MRFYLFFFIFTSILFSFDTHSRLCAKKGQYGYEGLYKIKRKPICCKGLVPMEPYGLVEGYCEKVTSSFGPCMPCGDGKCEYGLNENHCNCPEDCKGPKKCGELGDLVKGEKSKWTWKDSFLPDKCCRGLVKSHTTENPKTAKCIK